VFEKIKKKRKKMNLQIKRSPYEFSRSLDVSRLFVRFPFLKGKESFFDINNSEKHRIVVSIKKNYLELAGLTNEDDVIYNYLLYYHPFNMRDIDKSIREHVMKNKGKIIEEFRDLISSNRAEMNILKDYEIIYIVTEWLLGRNREYGLFDMDVRGILDDKITISDTSPRDSIYELLERLYEIREEMNGH
jgi:hypothetical protein